MHAKKVVHVACYGTCLWAKTSMSYARSVLCFTALPSVLHMLNHAADSCGMADRLLALEPGIQPVCHGQLLALVRWVSTTEQR